jgi:hypothetical protein
MLDSHPQLLIGPETEIFLPTPFWWESRYMNQLYLSEAYHTDHQLIETMMVDSPSQAEFADKFFNHVMKRLGKTRWGEKTPRHTFIIPYILEHWPNTKLVHLARDPRDTACSLRHHPKFVLDQNSEWVERDKNKVNSWNDNVAVWAEATTEALKWEDDPRYIRVQYEKLIDNPQPVLRAILEHVEIEWDDAVLYYMDADHLGEGLEAQNLGASKRLYRTSLNRWRTEMPGPVQKALRDRYGELAERSGYKLGS